MNYASPLRALAPERSQSKSFLGRRHLHPKLWEASRNNFSRGTASTLLKIQKQAYNKASPNEQELTDTDSAKFLTHQLRSGDSIQETLQREVSNRMCSQGLQLSLEVILKEALELWGLRHQQHLLQESGARLIAQK